MVSINYNEIRQFIIYCPLNIYSAFLLLLRLTSVYLLTQEFYTLSLNVNNILET